MDYQDGGYRRHNPTWHAEDSDWKAAKVDGIIARCGLTPRTIVDLGCGAGGVLAALAGLRPDPDMRFIGYDVSPDAIAQAVASHQSDPRLRFAVGAAPTEPADVILLIDVLEHVDDYFALLRKAHDHAPAVVAHIPIELTVSAVARRRPIMETREAVGHVHLFNRDTALAALEDTGFRIVEERYTARVLDRPTGTLRGKIAAGPRRLLGALSTEAAANWLGGYSLLVLATRA